MGKEILPNNSGVFLVDLIFKQRSDIIEMQKVNAIEPTTITRGARLSSSILCQIGAWICFLENKFIMENFLWMFCYQEIFDVEWKDRTV